MQKKGPGPQSGPGLTRNRAQGRFTCVIREGELYRQRRVSAQFRPRYPMNDMLTSKKPDIADWFYRPSWRLTAVPTTGELEAALSPVLLFNDELGLGESIAVELRRRGHRVIEASRGAEFDRGGADSYSIDEASVEHFQRLIDELVYEGAAPRAIVHLWNVTESSLDRAALTGFDGQLNRSFFSLFFLARAIGQAGLASPVRMTIISNNMQGAAGATITDPTKALLIGPCKVIPHEYPNISCRSIDIVLGASDGRHSRVVTALIAEIAAVAAEAMVAYRGEYRLAQSFEPVYIEEPVKATPRLRERGVYLITGGLGEIGLALAEYLAKLVRARLVLVGRAGLPSRPQWERWLAKHELQDETSRKIRRIMALEKTGAEVLISSADITSEEEARAATEAAKRRFGTVHGVFHAAGVRDDAEIRGKTTDSASRVLAPKVQGTLALDRALNGTPLDFFILFSSLSSICGPSGRIDYAAANAFLDAFAHYKTDRDGVFTLAINWSSWQTEHDPTKPAPQEDGILPSEGMEALRRTLALGSECQVVISPLDLQTVLEQVGNGRSIAAPTASSRVVRQLAPDEDEGEVARLNRQRAAKIFSSFVCSRGSEESPWPLLVPIRPEGSQPPFFCVHGRGGTVLNYFIFKRHLDADQPLYGLQAPGLDGVKRPFREMTALAGQYVKEIRAVQPHGPYYLGGGSMGGMVALEMAQQLIRDGEQIGLLAMFDTFGPYYFEYSPSSPSDRLAHLKTPRLRYHINELTSRGPREQIAYMWSRLAMRLKRRYRRIACDLYRRFRNPLPHHLRYWDVERYNLKALFEYVPQIYPGRITLFRAREQPPEVYHDPELGWSGKATGGVRIIEMPGSHETMLAHRLFGERLKITLREAQEKARASNPREVRDL